MSKDDNNKPEFSIEDLDRAPPNLPDRPADFTQARYDQLMQRFVEVSEDYVGAMEQNADLKRQQKTAEILDALIIPYANRTFAFMCGYCLFVAAMISLQAAGKVKVPIADGVMQILVGSTAVTVIGLVGMVLTGIFVGARKR